jgi:hypothetical protein
MSKMSEKEIENPYWVSKILNLIKEKKKEKPSLVSPSIPNESKKSE